MPTAITCTVVDELLLVGNPEVVDPIIGNIDSYFYRGTFLHGPGLFRIFGISTAQQDYYSATIDSDYNFEKDDIDMLFCKRCRKVGDPYISVEHKLFVSSNCSICSAGSKLSVLL